MNAEKIIRLIKKYRKAKLIRLSIKGLGRHEVGSHLIPYWTYLTLIRWTLEYSTNSARKDPDRQTIDKIAIMIHNQQNQHDFADLDKHGLKFFDVIGFQQIRFQNTAFIDVFGRSKILFSDNKLKNKYSFEDKFKEETSLLIEDFIVLLYRTFSIVKTQSIGEVNDQFLRLISTGYEFSKINSFLDLLTLNIYDSKDFIKKANNRVKNLQGQVFDNELFFETLFIKIHSKRYFLHTTILVNTAEIYLYQFLKARFDFAPAEFGNRFEKYVGKCLDECEIDYIDENKLERLYPGSNVVDYLVQGKVIVECKAIEMKAHVSVYPIANKLSNELKKSITKAYATQILTIANRIDNNSGKEYFGLIISYRDLFLGHTEELWSSFLREEVEKRSEEKGLNKNLVPIENLFIISIRDWEKLLISVRKTNKSIEEILRKVKQNNLTGKRKLFLRNHLDVYDIRFENLKMIDESFKNISDKGKITS